MDVSRRCVRISAAEINIMQILERRIVCGLYCKCRFRNVCRVYRERRYVGYRAYVALRYATWIFPLCTYVGMARHMYEH